MVSWFWWDLLDGNPVSKGKKQSLKKCHLITSIIFIMNIGLFKFTLAICENTTCAKLF